MIKSYFYGRLKFEVKLKSIPNEICWTRFKLKTILNETHAESVEDENGDELDHAVERHVLEHAERRDQSAPAFANHDRHAADVRNPENENII